MQLRELVWGLQSLQVTQTGSQNEKLDMDESKVDGDSASTAEHGGGKHRFCHQEKGQGWPGEMPSVHSVIHRCFALNYVTLGSLLTPLSLGFLSGSLRSHLPTGLWLNLMLPTVPTFTHGRPLPATEPP